MQPTPTQKSPLNLHIAEKTETSLRLEANRLNLIIYAVLGGLLAAGLGLLCLSFGVLTTLKCAGNPTSPASSEGQPNTRQITESTWLQSTQKTSFAVDQLRAARIDQPTATIVLTTSQGEIIFASLTHPHKVYSRESRVIAEINQFIRNPTSNTLLVKHNARPGLDSMGRLLLITGVAASLFTLTIPVKIRCIFDKAAEKMYLDRQRILGVHRDRCHLADIVAVAIQPETTYSKGEMIIAYHLTLVLRSGRSISIEQYPTSYQAYCNHVANEICQFLGIALA